MENAAICITAGEQSENHVGMIKNGNGLANVGFSFIELKQTLFGLLQSGIVLKSLKIQYINTN